VNVHRFIAQRPCLEELDGYIEGLKEQIAHPEKYPHGVQYENLSEEVLGPIETYRKRLLAGKEIPNPSKLERDWVYQRGRKPLFKPKKGPRT